MEEDLVSPCRDSGVRESRFDLSKVNVFEAEKEQGFDFLYRECFFRQCLDGFVLMGSLGAGTCQPLARFERSLHHKRQRFI
jgi:hypothetical protein